MPSTRGSSPSDARGEGRSQVAAALRGLDTFSFWVVPSPDPRSDDVLVAGTTGIFLVMPCALPGVLRFGVTGASIGAHKIPDVGGLKRRAKALQATLGSAAVYHRVETVVCLTRAMPGPERTSKGVRFVPLKDLAQDLSGRSASVPRGRAQRAARALGMHIAGDEHRHFSPG